MRRAKGLARLGAVGGWCALAAMTASLAACVPPADGPSTALAAAQAGPGGRVARLAAASRSAEAALPHAKTTLAPAPSAPVLLVPTALAASGKRLDAASGALALDRLKGLSARELAAALGDPTLLSRDGPAQIWQYAGQGCVLHVFLYQDGGSFRVRYSELRIDDPAAAPAPACAEWKGKPSARPVAAPGADVLPPGTAPLMSAASLRSSSE